MPAYYGVCDTSATGVWGAWTSNATTAWSYSPTWAQWNATTATATTTASFIWTGWNTGATATYGTQAGCLPQVRFTPEQQAKLEEERSARLKRDAEREAKRKAAAKRAEEMLKENLKREQLEEFEKSRHFHVVSKDGNRYRLRFGTHGNVEELDKSGKRVATWCIQPEGVPTGDAVLAQKLMLETDEQAFRRIGNRRAC